MVEWASFRAREIETVPSIEVIAYWCESHTAVEDWRAIQWSMEWFLIVDSSTSIYSMDHIFQWGLRKMTGGDDGNCRTFLEYWAVIQWSMEWFPWIGFRSRYCFAIWTSQQGIVIPWWAFFRTELEDRSEIQWLMEWCHWVDCLAIRWNCIIIGQSQCAMKENRGYLDFESRTELEDWWAIQWTMEWFPRVGSTATDFFNHHHIGYVAWCERVHEVAILLAYRYWRLVNSPMVEGMVPLSWFENKSLMTIVTREWVSISRVSNRDCSENRGDNRLVWVSYSTWRLASDPMVDGMVPESWFEYKYLSFRTQRNHTHQRTSEWECYVLCHSKVKSIVHNLEIGERSNRWRNSSWQLIREKLSGEHRNQGDWVKGTRDSRYCTGTVVVQDLKIGERTNLWWNGSRKLIKVQQAVLDKRAK